MTILGQSCDRARLVGQVLVAIPHLVVEVARSPIAIGVGLTGLHLVIIGLEDLGMFLVDIVDVGFAF